MSIEYLRSEVEMLRALLRDQDLTTGEELAIQHVMAKIRELTKHLLEKRNELIKEQELKSEPQMAKTIIRENKTRRVQLLMKPSLHETTKQKAQSLGLSFNDYVSMVLEEANSKE